jgi:hypothetical protein
VKGLVLAACLASSPAAEAEEAATIPFPRRLNPPVLLSMPTANVLGHGQYMLSGRFQYFTSSVIGDTAGGSADEDAAQARNYTYVSELLLGVENRAEIGVQYGRELSFSIKALLVREDVFWPDLVFGVRNIFGSPEGGLYGLEAGPTLRGLRGESFVTVAKGFPSGSRTHLGVSYLTGSGKGQATVNAGLEQDLGAGAYLGYEVFERFSDFHQVMSLNWRYKGFVAMSLGLTEFQSWVRQDGKWGLFLTPGKSRTDGYNSPGITFSMQVLGWAPRRQKRTLPERVASVEVRQVELERRVLELQEELLKARREAPLAPAAPAPTPASEPAADAGWVKATAALLKVVEERLKADPSDPGEVRQAMTAIVTQGPDGAEALRALAADTGAGSLRVSAVLTMGFSRDSTHAPALRSLCGDKVPRIRREALTALMKLDSKAALEDARRMVKDPDETVALAAGEAIRILAGAGSAPAAPAAKKAASGPSAAKR